METTTSADFHRKIGYYQDRAILESVIVTQNGRERLVLLAAEEYHRLKRLDREALSVSTLSDEELAAIGAAEVPAEHSPLDDELRG